MLRLTLSASALAVGVTSAQAGRYRVSAPATSTAKRPRVSATASSSESVAAITALFAGPSSVGRATSVRSLVSVITVIRTSDPRSTFSRRRTICRAGAVQPIEKRGPDASEYSASVPPWIGRYPQSPGVRG